MPGEVTAERFAEAATRIATAVRQVIDGKDEIVESALIALLAQGHLLIEDVPGVGKTQLARALAKAIDAEAHRIQFTPDLLPSDITGVSVYSPATGEFRFVPGAVFAPVVIADEINRASPKTQSALLEAMEERQVSADGRTRPLPEPFFVVATQNPLEMDGTYPLPEAQRDRFMMRLSMGYPSTEGELLMLRHRDQEDPLEKLAPVASLEEVIALIHWTRRVHIAPVLEQYAVGIARRTRSHPGVRLGASPRATIQLVRAAKARAALLGRAFVLPDDISALVGPVFGHRLLLARGAVDDHAAADALLTEVVAAVPVPRSDAR